jgi:hypothetical protein
MKAKTPLNIFKYSKRGLPIDQLVKKSYQLTSSFLLLFFSLLPCKSPPFLLHKLLKTG